jgi:hypothetical protein
MFTNILKNFVRHNRNNTVGLGLTAIAAVFILLYGSFITVFFATSSTYTFQYGWWLALPTAFTITAITHLIARTTVMTHYEKVTE